MRLFDFLTGTLGFELVLVIVAVLLALTIPKQINARLEYPRRVVQRLAAHPRLCLGLCFLYPVLIQVLLLPLYREPQPTIHDEFSHLLVADTLLHGRLANPPHPLWRHFETIHVIFDPAYASKYMVGQGAALALPQLVGLPAYCGVWISIGLMTAVLFWTLKAWISPTWALAGSLVILPRINVFGYWVHSYWGGAVGAIGGGLALGAFGRMTRKPSARLAWIMGAGLMIAANVRPYESAALGLVLGIALLVWLGRGGPARIVLPPLAIMGLITVGFVALHNYRVTGDPLKLPYERNRELYGTPQSFYWQALIPAVPSPHAEIVQNYRWQLEQHESGKNPAQLANITGTRLLELWLFFAGLLWTPALLFVPWLSSRLRVPLAALAIVIVATFLYPFFFTHYYGPVTGVFVLIILAGLERMYAFTLRGRRSGAAFCGLLFVLCPLTYLMFIHNDVIEARNIRQPRTPRNQLLDALNKMNGSHVVFVRYSPEHSFHKEIVYNAADIDSSPVIWARDMGPMQNMPVLQYYPGRRFWLFEPDLHPPRLSPYNNPFSVSPGSFPGSSFPAR